MLRLQRLFCLILLCLFSVLSPKAGAQIFADVTVGGGVSGMFTITLEHVKTPATVANFIRLATGQEGWVDVTTGAIRYEPFYNGVTFHRVIAGFMNQTGSRNGNGTDGPGYSFRDEFDPTLRHDAAYVVSMANSGAHTNGSQIFITVGQAAHLNDVHTVFGHVTAGQNVIDAINATPTNVANDKPLTPITIQTVSIYGPSLAGFNLKHAWLPTLADGKPVLKHPAADWLLGYDKKTYSDYLIFHSANLTTWSSLGSGYAGAAAFTADINVNASAVGNQHFYRIGRVDYSTAATADRAGNTFTFSNPLGGVAALNGTKTGGTWTFTGGSALTVTTATFDNVKPYSARLYLALSNGMQFLLTLQYQTPTAGKYSGQTNVNGFETVSGTFTLGP